MYACLLNSCMMRDLSHDRIDLSRTDAQLFISLHHSSGTRKGGFIAIKLTTVH